jgi:hypothetical protein
MSFAKTIEGSPTGQGFLEVYLDWETKIALFGNGWLHFPLYFLR